MKTAWIRTIRCGIATAFVGLAVPCSAANVADEVTLDDLVVPTACCDDACCGDPCDCGDACDCGASCKDGLLCGLIKPSDHCFDDFISPITNPTFFEDPRQLTEARGIFIDHVVPNGLAGGGRVDLFALQLRARVSDRLSIIATKDGYITSSFAPVRDGWADVAAGLKYTLYRDVQAQRLLSAGLTYFMPTGTGKTLQSQGDGDFHMFLTGGAQLLGYGHYVTGSGIRLPANNNLGTQMAYWSNHFDYQFLDGIYGLTEFNWYHWMSSGTQGLPGIEGGDLFNLGSTNVAGNDIATWAFGGKYKPSRNIELGSAYEIPMTNRKDVLQSRLTIDAIIRY